MRTFLAIEIPTQVKKKIAESLRTLQMTYREFNWVDENNYHVTVYFYGEMSIAEKDKMKETLAQLLHDEDPFYLYSNSVNLFMHHNIIIHLNFRREKRFERIAAKIKETFVIQNTTDTRKITPHITLARCRIPSKQQYFVLKKRLEKLQIAIDFPVKKITLFESVLTSKKPIYKKLSLYPLGSA